jgi:hypothetical protein
MHVVLPFVPSHSQCPVNHSTLCKGITEAYMSNVNMSLQCSDV